jgi:hypothetical protein
VETLILLAILAYAIKKAAENGHLHWQGSKAANRRSTRGKTIPKRAASAVQHDVGYWAHQILNGFPQARRGLANGWHAGRTAQAEGAAERHKARTEHLERHAGLLEQIREHRRRQDEALERIRAAQEPGPEPGPHPIRGREDLPAPDEPLPSQPARQGPPEPVPPAQGSEGTPEGTSPQASPGPAAEEDTQPGTPEPPAQPRQGDQNMSETTYQGVQSMMETAAAEAEQYAAEAEQSQTVTEEHAEQARQAKQRGTTAAEEMQSLAVDAETLSAMADHLQALDDAEKHAAELNDQVTLLKEAWQRVQETAGQVRGQLDASGHGALDEAHANAAGGGAERAFYGEGG